MGESNSYNWKAKIQNFSGQCLGKSMTSSGLKQHLATALHYLWSWQKNVLRIFQGVLDDTAPKGKKTAFDASKSCPSNWQKSWHYFMGGTSD